MNCPICGCSLTPLQAALAETSIGAQCPKCWMQIRFLLKGTASPGRVSIHSAKRPEKPIKARLVS